MNCCKCGNELHPSDCSDKEGLVFYCNCLNCDTLNMIRIDLDTNKFITTKVCHGNEQAKKLFDKKEQLRIKNEYENFKKDARNTVDFFKKINNSNPFDEVSDKYFKTVKDRNRKHSVTRVTWNL